MRVLTNFAIETAQMKPTIYHNGNVSGMPQDKQS